MSDEMGEYFDFETGDTVRVRVRDDDGNVIVDFTAVCSTFEYYPGDATPIAVFELPQAHPGKFGAVAYDALSAEFEVER